jgi:hypothetical protein
MEPDYLELADHRHSAVDIYALTRVYSSSRKSLDMLSGTTRKHIKDNHPGWWIEIPSLMNKMFWLPVDSSY